MIERSRLSRAAFLLHESAGHGHQEVFNTTVENAVEKPVCILLSHSARNGSAFCTRARA